MRAKKLTKERPAAMKKFDLEKIIIALVPAALSAPGFQPALFQATCAVAGYWLTACFFKWSRVLFPGKFLEAALILWLAAWMQLTHVFWNIPPFWVLSVILFLPNRAVTNAGWVSFLRKLVFQGIIFWVFALLIGAFRDAVSSIPQQTLIQSPAGFFLFLFIPIFLRQNAVRRE